MNSAQIVGAVVGISRPDGRGTSALVTVRHGPIRKIRKNRDRQFVNVVQVRVPERNLKDIEGLEKGMLIQVFARLQGIVQVNQTGPMQMYTEVVASRIVPFPIADLDETPPSVTAPDDDEITLDQAVESATH